MAANHARSPGFGPGGGRYGGFMVVRINRVYTKVGDNGTTALGDGSRVPKTSPRLGAYADTDEANSVIGLALAMGALPDDVVAVLRAVQNDLFDVGADLCLPLQENPPYEPLRITEAYVERLEGWCDEFNERLPKLTSFILPGGTPGAALLHVARTVTRRAERSAWQLIESEPERTTPVPARYLNRLSDLLFILARSANPAGDVLWRPGGNR
jgi:cob(I)alamin adenosyltransferase